MPHAGVRPERVVHAACRDNKAEHQRNNKGTILLGPGPGEDRCGHPEALLRPEKPRGHPEALARPEKPLICTAIRKPLQIRPPSRTFAGATAGNYPRQGPDPGPRNRTAIRNP